MLNDIEFSHYCNRLNLPEFAVKYIERVRASGPSRKVRCGPNNVIAQYPSRKMARMIPAESHTVELTFIQQLEHDDDVIEYYAQPFPIKLNYASASGRPVGVVHTPDFLVLETNTAGWVECKTQESLNKLGSVQPHRYRGDDKGQWRCPPGEEAANPLGLYYKVWNSAEADPTVMRNMRFLEDYFDPEYPEVPVALKESVLGTVKRCPGMMAQTLVEKVNGC